MAFFPLCDQKGFPVLFNEEKVVVRKEKVFGKLSFTTGLKVAFVGTLYLTNCRLILINTDEGFNVKYNYALHLNLVYQVTFGNLSIHKNPMIEGKFDKFDNLMPAGGSFAFEMLKINPELVQYLTELIEKIRLTPTRIIQAFINPRNPDILIVQDLNQKKNNLD